MRQVYYECSRQGSKVMGPVDTLIGDPTSYLNYIDDLDQEVRVAKIEGDKAPSNVRMGVQFLDATFFMEEDIIPASFTTAAAQDGVIYYLKSSTWHLFTLGHDAGRETKGDFAVRGPFRIPDQDIYRYEIVLMMGLHTTQLRANFAVTGAGTP